MSSSYNMYMVFWMAWLLVLTLCVLFKRVGHGQRVHELPMGPRSSYIPKSLAWKFMTLPAIPSILFFYAQAGGFSTHGLLSASAGFVGLYCVHYLYRSVVYPCRLRTSEQQCSIMLIGVTWSYYIPMGYFLGTRFARADISASAPSPTIAVLGLAVFAVGLLSTIAHDEILIRLRSTPSREYAIPMRGLFRYTTNAHYFSEVVEWTGFALLTLTMPAFIHLLAVFTLMLPQAMKTHTWYRHHFGTRYPANRTAFFPFLF